MPRIVSLLMSGKVTRNEPAGADQPGKYHVWITVDDGAATWEYTMDTDRAAEWPVGLQVKWRMEVDA